MVTYVVDASAVLRYLDAEEGAVRFRAIFQERFKESARIVISAIHWGEVGGVLYKRDGLQSMQKVLAGLEHAGIQVIPALADQAVRSALLKRRLKVPYADSFGIALTQELTQSIFATADYDFKTVDHLVAIEFIGTKPLQSFSTTP